MPTIEKSAHPFPHTDSADLLRRVAAGRPGAWAELVRTYEPLLRSRVRRYRLQEADALDVVQTTWVRLSENLARIHTPEHLAGWLATVVSRECLRVLQSGNRSLELDESLFDERTERPAGPEQLAVESAVVADVRSALATLTPHRRSLVSALFADDREPYADIAQNLGIPIGSIGPTRARTLAELRGVLEQRGVGR